MAYSSFHYSDPYDQRTIHSQYEVEVDNTDDYSSHRYYSGKHRNHRRRGVYTKALVGKGRGRARGGRGGRGRGRNRYVQQYYEPQIQAPQLASASSGHPGDHNDADDVCNRVDPVVEKILQQLSFPQKNAYRAKDIVWVKHSDYKWEICVVKYVLSQTELIVRPIGKSQMSEISISTKQIHGTAELLSVHELRRCIESMKAEIYNFHNYDKDIFQGSLIKCKDNLFGKVVRRDTGGKYTVQISDKCVWYNGAKCLESISPTQIMIIDEFEFKYNILSHEKEDRDDAGSDDNNEEINIRQKYDYYDYDEDSQCVYDFLDDVADQYITTFLVNGFDRLQIVLCLKELDLKQMNVKLGHRRYIMYKINSFEEGKFAISRARKKQMREKNKNINDNGGGDDDGGGDNDNKEDRGSAAAGRNKSPKVIIYDFHQTLTQHYFMKRDDGGADHRDYIAIFGGTDRIARLQTHFEILLQHNVGIVIVSFELCPVMKEALERVDLYKYFRNAIIIGNESSELTRNASKANCILNMFRTSYKNLNEDDILFVDDDPNHINEVMKKRICKTMQIEQRHGMTHLHMSMIENLFIHKSSLMKEKEDNYDNMGLDLHVNDDGYEYNYKQQNEGGVD